MEDRIFYVDAALSKYRHKETNKRLWKCSVVENGKHVISWVNSVCNKITVSKKNGKHYQSGTCSAEAYTVMKLVFWLVERKFEGSIRVFTDNSLVSDYCKRNKSKTVASNSKKIFRRYLSLACKTANEKNIDLNVDWIKGTENPADYYSRI